MTEIQRETDATAAEVAAVLRCSRRKVTDEASRRGIGYNLGGRAGFRFTAHDIEKLRQAMTPAAPVEERRTA